MSTSDDGRSDRGPGIIAAAIVAAALILSWVPFVGDALCVASGWLRQNVAAAAAFIAAGKFARYWVLAEGLAFFSS